MIRPAQPTDLERLVEMGVRFISETGYRDLIAVDPARLSETMVKLAASDDALILVSDVDGRAVGAIAMVLYDHPFAQTRTASEMFWWVDPEARGDGLRLLRAAEKWAQERGAAIVQMIAPTPRVSDLYRRLGYREVETSFQRSL